MLPRDGAEHHYGMKPSSGEPAVRRRRRYPATARPGDDPRFTLGLVLDVARVLEQHGYPPVKAGLDLADLQQSLYGFLYDTGRSTP